MSRIERYIWGILYWLALYTSAIGICVLGDRLLPDIYEPILVLLVLFCLVHRRLAWRRTGRRIETRMGFAARTVRDRIRLHLGWRLVWPLLRRGTSTVDVMGFTTHIDGPLDSRSDVPLRLAASLKVLREVAPARYVRLARLRPEFYIGPHLCTPAGYMPEAHILALRSDWVLQTSAAVLSGLVAHELSHAYTCSLGLQTRAPWVDSRLEVAATNETGWYGVRLRTHNYRPDAQEVFRIATANMNRWFWRKDGSRFRRAEDGTIVNEGYKGRAPRRQVAAVGAAS